jgi:4-hydroxybenzoate polyprenyltransferase
MLSRPESPPESTASAIFRLLRWDKPEGRLILMIPALWAIVLATKGQPPLLLVGIIILGSLATSAAGCVANDLWDRNIDNQVERTRSRPLASRALSVKVGVGVMLMSFLCAAGLAAFLNWTTFVLCCLAVPVIGLYPAMKRVFVLPQLVLSIAWGFAVLISWSMVSCVASPTFAPATCLNSSTWLLWAATVLWTMGFDTVYAMSDREDDRRIGVKSSALFFGQYAPQAVGICYLGTALVLARLAIGLSLGVIFWPIWAMALLGWGWQYMQLIQPEIPRLRYNQFFKHNVWIGALLLVGMILGIRA